MPYNLLIHGEHIMIFDFKTEWFYKIFSKNSFEYEGNLLRRGRGPMEETDVMPFFKNYSSDAFLFKSTSDIKVANIQHSGDGLSLDILDEFALPAGMYADYDFFLLEDKICSANTFSSPERDFKCFNLNTDSIFEWGELTPLQRPESLPPHEVFFLAKYTTISPNRNLLAVAYQNLPILRIYCTKSGQMLHQLQMADGSGNVEYFERNIFDRGFISFYGQVKSTREYIYALYRGSELFVEDENMPDHASVLHVWKWDGTPVMAIEFDRPITSYDISPDNKQIIASSVVDVDRLFVADIPWGEEDE